MNILNDKNVGLYIAIRKTGGMDSIVIAKNFFTHNFLGGALQNHK
jgi:hypothetical protein